MKGGYTQKEDTELVRAGLFFGGARGGGGGWRRRSLLLLKLTERFGEVVFTQD